MGAFDKIKTGLEEAIAYEQGTLEAKARKATVQPADHYETVSAEQIAEDAAQILAEFTDDYKRLAE